MAADEASVRVERVTGPSGHPLALVTIDRAPVNAFDSVTKERLIAVAHELSRPGDVRAVVLTGRRIFSAGDDIVEMAAADRAYAARGLERISDAVSAVAAIPVPVVAAVQGAALGGGCELALAADFRVAAHDSTWGLPEVHLGLIPAGGGTQRLPRLVGTARAKRMIYLGESVSGDVALDWGLVDEAVAPDDVVDRALALADELEHPCPGGPAGGQEGRGHRDCRRPGHRPAPRDGALRLRLRDRRRRDRTQLVPGQRLPTGAVRGPLSALRPGSPARGG